MKKTIFNQRKAKSLSSFCTRIFQQCIRYTANSGLADHAMIRGPSFHWGKPPASSTTASMKIFSCRNQCDCNDIKVSLWQFSAKKRFIRLLSVSTHFKVFGHTWDIRVHHQVCKISSASSTFRFRLLPLISLPVAAPPVLVAQCERAAWVANESSLSEAQ